MTYANSFNPYYQQYPAHFTNAMQQVYNPQPQQMMQQPQPQVQQQMQPQPATVQPQVVSKIITVTSKEEASATPIDIVNGTPTFFFNKGKNEIYLKQCDVQTGNAIWKTFTEVQPEEEKKPETIIINYDEQFENINNDFKHLGEGIDSIHRILSKMQSKEDVEEEIIKSKKRG